MRKITSSLAALVSLLLVSSPVSSWACDFSCSSHQAPSDCHTSATTGQDDTAVSMPPGMDMGSDQTESPMEPDSVVSATPAHSMFMSPQQRMTTDRFDLATNTRMRTAAMDAHSKSVSSCTHETCRQASVSASPPGPDHSQPNSVHRMAISISCPVNLWISFHSISPGAPPPKLLAAGRLITTLRI